MTYTIYSKAGCPFCTKVEQVLQLTEQPYVVLKLGRDYNREEFYSKFGKGSTFPRVVLGEQLLGGCTETVKYLKENNIV